MIVHKVSSNLIAGCCGAETGRPVKHDSWLQVVLDSKIISPEMEQPLWLLEARILFPCTPFCARVCALQPLLEVVCLLHGWVWHACPSPSIPAAKVCPVFSQPCPMFPGMLWWLPRVQIVPMLAAGRVFPRAAGFVDCYPSPQCGSSNLLPTRFWGAFQAIQAPCLKLYTANGLSKVCGKPSSRILRLEHLSHPHAIMLHERLPPGGARPAPVPVLRHLTPYSNESVQACWPATLRIAVAATSTRDRAMSHACLSRGSSENGRYPPHRRVQCTIRFTLSYWPSGMVHLLGHFELDHDRNRRLTSLQAPHHLGEQ